jgi:hypothetical protein
MYVTGSDAWTFQEHMSEGSNRAVKKACLKCGRVYPTLCGAATNVGACFVSNNGHFRHKVPRPFAYCRGAPIFG